MWTCFIALMICQHTVLDVNKYKPCICQFCCVKREIKFCFDGFDVRRCMFCCSPVSLNLVFRCSPVYIFNNSIIKIAFY